jgi:hypothetical protein
MLTPTDLVDADAEQPVETAWVQLGGDDTFTRPPDRAPRHPTEPRDRGLVGAGRQPRHQVIEVAGQMRARAGERDRLGDDTVDRATQPTELRVDPDPPHPHIEVAPHRPTRPGVVAGPSRKRAVRTRKALAAQHDGHGDHVDREHDRGDVHPLEADKALEYSRDAHGRGTSQVLGLGTSNLGLSPCTSRGPPQTAPSARPCWTTSPQPTHTRVRRAEKGVGLRYKFPL